ncbi:response regulator [Vibrio campbellii]|uniref:response regulator n=1 Tax=Vibrio campbellii TaxID=680 RepID=UPI0005ED91CB|nr:response regulator [Vibrio campbellii]AQM66994.1 Cell cycle response regulator CtrA [Vibrio campbellii]PQJ46110.1 response regulator [Vibrio campbellii]UMM01663.1 response regulator [Vibrio campbellii]
MKILICDDSAVARKLITRSIVQDTSLHLLEAQDGHEALKILAEQNIDVLFLDLTMPVMDGFEVLESLPVSQYPTKIVIISGDVQHEAKQRCLELGAMDFIAKPLAEEEIIPLYEKLGLHYAFSAHTNAEPSPVAEVSPLSKFREVANIALGKGAAIMADHLREFIQLPVPHVGPLSYGELHMTLVDVIGRDGSVAVAQRFVGGGIHGEALVCLRGKDINQIGERLGYLLEFTPHNEIILNVSNLLVSSFLTSLGNQLDKQFSLRQPGIIETITPYCEEKEESGELFTIEYTYMAESLDFECEVLFLIDKSSVDIIYEIMELI